MSGVTILQRTMVPYGVQYFRTDRRCWAPQLFLRQHFSQMVYFRRRSGNANVLNSERG